jgi:hypothetical protein
MASIAFSVPIKPGQSDHLFDHVEHITGHGREAHHEKHSRHGLTHIRLYHQTQPSEALIVYLEGPHLQKSLDEIMEDPDLADQPWYKMIEKLSDHKGHHFHLEGSQLVMDWHHQEGHRHQPVKRQ